MAWATGTRRTIKGGVMDNTIHDDSSLGKRLKNINRTRTSFVVFMGKSIPMVAQMTIGRERDNSIVIDDNMASRHHAVIQKIKEDFYVKDLGSTNGTIVNDVRIENDKYVKLHQKDVIRIGRTEFTIK
jgi:pSer/pThr/pTyr-binding forkhead associated (FHA) protein